jgi:hypothetical protein
LHATRAAQEKLKGKSTCPVEVKRGPDVPQETHYKDWLAFLAEARELFKNIEGSSKDALVVRAHETLLSEARFCGVEADPDHDCTSEELQDIEQNPDSKVQWIRGCHSEHYTKYEVFDRAKETWTLRLRQLDDASPDLREAEKVHVELEPQRLVVTGPGCNEVFPLPKASPPQ